MVDWAQLLATTLASSAGALLAAAVGTRLAMRKFRQERSYDARVAWHRDLAETVKVLKNRSQAIRYFDKRDSAAKQLAVVQNIADLAFKFQELAAQAPLYARKQTCVAISEVVSEMNALRPLLESPSPSSAEQPEHTADPHELSMAGLQLIFDMLARDLRELLGLEKLDEHDALARIERTRKAPRWK